MEQVVLNSNYLDGCTRDKDGYFNSFGNSDKYKKVDRLWEDKFTCVIHLYPFKDTTDDEGDLLGFDDSLFFKAVIYNEDINEYYITTGRPIDNIGSRGNMGIKFQVRMFKDMSTMFIFEDKVFVSQVCSDLTIK